LAFDIHTNPGATGTGAKVNNRAVPIREVLNNGDIVEVMTQKNQTPKSDWLSFCVTSKARGRIKSWLRNEQMKHARIGREELERKLKNWKITVPIDEVVAYLGKVLKVRTGRELYSIIAEQKIDFQSIKEILNRWLSGQAEEQRREAAAEAERKKEEAKAQQMEESPSQHRSDALVIDEKINNIEYKLAKCCNPIKGDDIFGFVTISSGITIHRSDCPNAARLRENYPYRIMDARWRKSADGAFRATIAIVASDLSGIGNQITEVVSRDMKLNIRSINLNSRGDGMGVGTISVEVPSVGVVDSLIHAIMRIKGIQRAYRVKN
jgi:GTP pyrophosphokinase